MSRQTYTYDAYSIQQTEDSPRLIMFAAPAPQIEQWVGIPQRGRLDDGETVGFQRQENQTRVKELAGFFDERRNVVQNPLLAALQDEASVTFSQHGDGPFGKLEIQIEPLSEFPLLDLIQRVITRLETRVPSLKEQTIDDDRRRSLFQRASELHELHEDSETDESQYDEDQVEDVDLDEDAFVGSALLTEETQLVDFHQELVIRAEILERLAGSEMPEDILGFSKDAMIGYLQPVVLVDGQHRLRGAVKSARDATDSDEGRALVRSAMDAGAGPSEAHRKVLLENARSLPVSLLLDASPSEHVFQFVVVNQKATPMSSALLGTIVSTSLSRDELKPVATRLMNAGIQLEDAQAVAYLTRANESPFKALVQTGITGDNTGLLPWSVLNSLTSIFRELKGGKLYHQTNDYAAKWRNRGGFRESQFVAEGTDDLEKYAIWSAPDGPWRSVFIRFYTLVRERFGSNDPGANNYWGDTSSNLYNKISLTILAADFFQFLDERRGANLDTLQDVDDLFSEWLDGVSDQYFAREWRMRGLKKDQSAVQKKWSELWFEYRKDPERMPRVDSFRP